MNISMVLPTCVPDDRTINVTLCGAGFEFAICKSIVCKFGDVRSNGSIVDLNEISCPISTKAEGGSAVVPVLLVVDGKTIIRSRLTYRFVPSLAVIDDQIEIGDP